MNPNIDKLMTLMGPLFNLCQAGILSEEEVEAKLEGMYESIVAEYKPILKVVMPMILSKFSEDLALPLARAFFKEVLLKLQTDEEFIENYFAYKKTQAQNRHKIIETYMEAGFDRSEAMSLLLTDISKQPDIYKAMQNAPKTQS